MYICTYIHIYIYTYIHIGHTCTHVVIGHVFIYVYLAQVPSSASGRVGLTLGSIDVGSGENVGFIRFEITCLEMIYDVSV